MFSKSKLPNTKVTQKKTNLNYCDSDTLQFSTHFQCTELQYGPWNRRKKAQPGKLGSYIATKWRRLELGTCIRFLFNEMQNGNGVNSRTP